MLLSVILLWLVSSMTVAWKIAPSADEDDLCLVILFAVFWPVAAVAFHRWADARKKEDNR